MNTQNSLVDLGMIKTKSNLKQKKKWTVIEDELLKLAVNEKGTKSWINISVEMNGRTAKQCRERWHHNLEGSLRKGDWTTEEDSVVLKMQKQVGNHWAQIAAALNGRAAIDVKNRFKKLQKMNKRQNIDSYDERHVKADHCTNESLPTRSIQSPFTSTNTPKLSCKYDTTGGAVWVITADNCDLLKLFNILSTKRPISALCDFQDLEKHKLFCSDS